MTRVSNRYPRIPCIVPYCGCGATCYPPGYEIICSKHYRLVDRALKTLRRRARKAGKNRLDHMLWQRIKRQAIERAMGITA